MKWAFVVCGFAACVGLAAPVPKDIETPEKKIERLFGKSVVPGEGEVTVEGKTLRIRVAELPGGKPGDSPLLSCPRTERIVTGEFELTVLTRLPEPKDAVADAWAGVFVRFGENYFEYMRYWMDQAPRPGFNIRGRGVWSQVRTKGLQSDLFSYGILTEAEKNVANAQIRVTRKDGQIVAETKHWKGDWGELANPTAATPDEVTVGVYVGGRKGPYTAEFEDFKVTKLEK